MKYFTRFIFGAILLSVSATSQAALVLGFSPSSQTVSVGSSLGVDLTISGLGNFAPDSLGAFDVDVLFDNSILGFTGAIYGDPVLGDQLDLFSLGSFTGTTHTPGAGAVNLFQLSFDTVSDLDTMQADSFTLATLTFDALAIGSSSLNFGSITLSDAIGGALTANTAPGQVNVVPIPAAIWLFGTALLALVGLSRRRKVA